MQFITSTKGGRKLLLDGYIYVKKKALANDWVNYECENRRYRQTCKALVRVRGEEFRKVGEHTHAPNQAKTNAAKCLQRMRVRAETTGESTQHILSNNLQDVDENTACHLPDMDSIRRNIRRQRQKAGNPLPVPLNREDIPNPLPDSYRQTSNGENFLLYDSGDEDRILVFGTTEGLQLLGTNEHWFMDGTFKTVPPLFVQLYTIHALVEGRVIPAVYTLLPNKQFQTYRRLLAVLLTQNMDLSPSSVLMDFERAAQNAAAEVFPEATVKGCFFHLSQAIFRKVQAEGLQQ